MYDIERSESSMGSHQNTTCKYYKYVLQNKHPPGGTRAHYHRQEVKPSSGKLPAGCTHEYLLFHGHAVICLLNLELNKLTSIWSWYCL